MAKADAEKLKARYLKARNALRAHQKGKREKRRKEEARKETARNILAGKLVFSLVENGEWPRESFMTSLGKYLSDDDDRSLFGLLPLDKKAAPRLENPRRKGGHMTRKELIDRVVECSEASLSKKDAGVLLDAVFGAIGRAIREKKRFAYPGFGTFTLRQRAARRGRNPQTGAVIEVKAGVTVGFKPAPSLKRGL